MSRRRVHLLLAAVALVLAGVVSSFASDRPDGLERVAHDQGFADSAKTHAVDDGPLAHYGLRGLDDDLLSGGVAGVAGVLVVLVLASGVAFAVRRKNADRRGR